MSASTLFFVVFVKNNVKGSVFCPLTPPLCFAIAICYFACYTFSHFVILVPISLSRVRALAKARQRERRGGHGTKQKSRQNLQAARTTL